MKRISSLEKKYVQEVLDSQFNSKDGAKFNKLLEKKFKKKFKCKYAIPVANGTAGLHIALLTFGLSKKDEVIVPALTMSSTAISVLLAGGTPIFADIDPKTFLIDPKSIKKSINKNTKGIITVSLYGLMPDYKEIKKITSKKNIFIIEDNAECFLGRSLKNITGSYGEFSMYSFQSSKHITCGNGGIITTNKRDLYEKAKEISNLGYPISGKKSFTRNNIQDPNFERHKVLGLNYRLPELCAAVAYAQLERIEDLIRVRKEAGKKFKKIIKEFSFVKEQKVPKGYIHTYWCFPFVLNFKNKNIWFKFKKIFNKNGGDFFYAAWKPAYLEPLFKTIYSSTVINKKYSKGLCPNAEYIQERVVQLKTNYWAPRRLNAQLGILRKTLKEIEYEYLSKNL